MPILFFGFRKILVIARRINLLVLPILDTIGERRYEQLRGNQD
jgi:hypothetical protein